MGQVYSFGTVECVALLGAVESPSVNVTRGVGCSRGMAWSMRVWIRIGKGMRSCARGSGGGQEGQKQHSNDIL